MPPLSPLYLSSLFVYDRENHTMTAEALELGVAFAPSSGAMDVPAIRIQSTRTDRVVDYTLDDIEVSNGEYDAWVFKPVDKTDSTLPTVVVFNN